MLPSLISMHIGTENQNLDGHLCSGIKKQILCTNIILQYQYELHDRKSTDSIDHRRHKFVGKARSSEWSKWGERSDLQWSLSAPFGKTVILVNRLIGHFWKQGWLQSILHILLQMAETELMTCINRETNEWIKFFPKNCSSFTVHLATKKSSSLQKCIPLSHIIQYNRDLILSNLRQKDRQTIPTAYYFQLTMCNKRTNSLAQCIKYKRW
jgi:hypothetical protein